MLNCHSCIRRHIQACVDDSFFQHLNLNSFTIPRYSSINARTFSLAATSIRPQDFAEHITASEHDTQDKHKLPVIRTGSAGKTLIREEWLQSRGKRPRSNLVVDLPSTFATRKELRYLGDPLKLANHVLGVLREGRFEVAHRLVQTASRNSQCTVSWNHLVNWQMSNGKVNGAVKTYNEMKKRGQTPDARTYTILFRGFAEFSRYPNALPKALSIYHSMDAENSPVKPNVIHTNAVLKVCARAEDLDAMFGIAAKLQRKGFRAPNNLTFTTILNAIYRNALLVQKNTKISREEKEAVCRKTIIDARKMWDDIISRWHQGDIWIDEELVCSMGRILLLGNTQDVDDVLSLVQQTMNISRLVPRLGTPARDQIGPASQEKPGSLVPNNTSHEDGIDSLVRGDQFNVANPPPPTPGRSVYARPGQNSLSLVLEALQKLRMKAPFEAYWKIFTESYGVVPDNQNFHSYIRLLRLFRASSQTVDVLIKMPKAMLEKKTFRIAMSTCARDKGSRVCFANAGKILDLMQQTQVDLDLPALHSYMEVAVGGRIAFAKNHTEAEKQAQGKIILRALERLGPAIVNIRSALAYNKQTISREGPETFRQSAIALVREMISAYDKVINHCAMAPSKVGALKAERSKLATFVTRYNANGPKTKGAEVSLARKMYSTRAPDCGHDEKKHNQ